MCRRVCSVFLPLHIRCPICRLFCVHFLRAIGTTRIINEIIIECGARAVLIQYRPTYLVKKTCLSNIVYVQGCINATLFWPEDRCVFTSVVKRRYSLLIRALNIMYQLCYSTSGVPSYQLQCILGMCPPIELKQ